MAAALTGKPGAVEPLLNTGVNLDAHDAGGQTAMIYSLSKDALEIAERLLKAGALREREDLLVAAAQQGRLDWSRRSSARPGDRDEEPTGAPRRLPAPPPPINTPSSDSALERGANINATDADGRTPLIEAAASGDLPIVETLLKHGADVEAADRAGGGGLDARL
ncbi:MAG: ankyrin repeat domain-containing protein [Acidobacteria bacterium]|nr:ankyrin repeat domain-containing protein [Acidobacteriota bacterium]